MNVYFGVIGFILSTFIGYRLSVKFTQRKSFYNTFYNFNEKMLDEISFSSKSLLTLIEKESVNSNDFYVILQKKIIKSDYNYPQYLKPEDKIFFEEYEKLLGKSDKKSQNEFLTAKKNELLKLKTESEQEEKKYKNLYVKLGFLLGLVMLVVSF
ncbi:MAG: hypothetical protein SPL13_05465 [Clostridia bacterium]|nr:hypothetical protein [Clostridia bacterium]